MQTSKILFWTSVLALLLLLGLRLRHELRIDSCLDRGGSWEEDRQVCVGATE